MASSLPNVEPTSHDARHASRSAHAPNASEVGPSSTREATRHQTSPVAAAPSRRTFFDPWNSSSTGHQRAENHLSGSTSWRASRSLKLGEQFKGGREGGKRVADTVGAGSEDFGKDGRKDNGSWENGAKGLRTGGQKSLAEIWAVSKVGRKQIQEKDIEGVAHASSKGQTQASTTPSDVGTDSDTCVRSNLSELPSRPPEKQMFAGLCFYLNGSTAPLVSDHKLKQLCAAHGASHSISLGRRTVTHVILGRVNPKGGGSGAGGGLAATKIQKEITRTGSKAVKFISAEW
jgi:hypothetical protein